MKKRLIILAIVLSLSSCGWGGIKATIRFDPKNQMAVYEGPKDVDFSFKGKGGLDAKYSGKTAPWWHGMLPFLFKAVPDVEIVK